MNERSIGHYYPQWLTDQECGESYKRQLVTIYNDYFKEQDKKLKQEKLDQVKVYLTIVCDVVAYRYLVKHYSNLFYRLHLTVEEYMEYKVDRMFTTIKDKKDKIDDILSYVYMSFMLSSPRLIYDYAEKVGRCKLVKETLPYFQVQRLKFFFIERENSVEHIILDFNIVDMDSTEKSVRSDIERYSLFEYNYRASLESSESSTDLLIDFVNKIEIENEKSKTFVLNIFSHWKSEVEDEYLSIKQSLKSSESFNLIDYVRYKYENQQTNLNYVEYIEVLNILNKILKGKKDILV